MSKSLEHQTHRPQLQKHINSFVSDPTNAKPMHLS